MGLREHEASNNNSKKPLSSLGVKGQGKEVELIDSIQKVSPRLGQESHAVEAIVVEELSYLQSPVLKQGGH